MDQVINQQQGAEGPNRSRLTEIILIAAITLTCIILGLFYFDILPIPFKLPGQTGKPTPAPKPVAFQYDGAKAKTLLTQYIKDTLKPEFVPANIEVKQGLTIDGRLGESKKEFGLFLTTPTATVSVNFHYKENTNTPNDYFIFIDSKNATQTTMTASLANSLLSSYFTNPYVISDCQTKGITSYCENFQILNEGKRGYGVTFINTTPKLTRIIFNCFISKEDKDYSNTKSCITPL